MSTKKHVLAALALALVFVPVAVAQNPKKPAPPTPVTPATTALTLDAKPTTIVYANVTTLSGRLSGRGTVRNVVLRVWHDATAPSGDSYTRTSTTVTTTNNGRYSLTAKPLVNTQYRVLTNVAP